LLAWNYRRILLAHHDAARVIAATLPVGPNRWRLIEQVLSIFRAGGFSDEDIADASWVFNSYIIGFVLDETQSLPTTEHTEVAEEQAQAQVRQWFTTLPAERYPELVALADHLVNASVERRFKFGLTVMLDGLELRLASRQST
jgi:hypothetical protein